MENSNSKKNNNNFLIDMSDEYKQIKRQNELVKSQDNNTKLKKIKTNIFGSSEIIPKILNKRTKLNNLCNSIFSNMEINKYINECKKTSIQKAGTYFTKKLSNRNNIGIQSELDDELYLSNRKSEKDFYTKDKITLKDESTNTYNNFVNINNYDYGKFHSFETNENNIYEKNNFFIKTPMNKRNNQINFEEKTKTFNKTKNNRKSNRLNKISINNNVKFKNESNDNNYKYYLELYKFYLIQSVTQKRGNSFNLKNKNSNGNKIKIPNPLLFLHNSRNNIDEDKKCSLRELYRYLNYDKLAISLYQMSQTKKNQLKKKINKTNDKKIKKQTIFNRNNNHRLMNVQYNIDEYLKNKNKENKDFFQRTLFEKKVFNINMKNNENIKNENKSDYYIKKNFIKTSKNFRDNNMKEKFNPIKDKTFDKGITSLSPNIKSYQKYHLKLINKRNNRNNKNTLK